MIAEPQLGEDIEFVLIVEKREKEKADILVAEVPVQEKDGFVILVVMVGGVKKVLEVQQFAHDVRKVI
jgi:hypothetical protein